jgi:hypothetical protein
MFKPNYREPKGHPQLSEALLGLDERRFNGFRVA